MTIATLFGNTVLDEIEYGGLGPVLRVHDPRGRRDLVYRRLGPELLQDTPRFERLQDECRRAGELHHSHIAANLGVCEEAGEHYVGLQYHAGERLIDLIQRGPLAPERAVHVATNIAETLARIHDRGWVHGDLKPANVIVDREAVLIDVGLACLNAPVKVTDALAPLKEPTTSELTRWAPHQSPEQAQGLELDRRSDIYSLASLLYAMLTGAPPFQRATGMESLTALLRDPTPRLAEAADPGLREIVRFQQILDRGLARERADRYLLLRPSHVFRHEEGDEPTESRSLAEDLHAMSLELARPVEPPKRAGCMGALVALAGLIATACTLLS